LPHPAPAHLSVSPTSTLSCSGFSASRGIRATPLH
jgi:hypothetical protein